VIQASIRDKKISMGHARALISVEDSDKQLYIYQEVIKNGLSVRKVEELVRQIHTIGKDKKKSKARVISFQYMKIQDDLASKFSTNVKLKLGDKGKGSIEINFMSDDDLARILEMLDW
jgi:ParB family chromosome partitioning protein